MTPEGLAQLSSDEGERAKVYDDATGLPIKPGTRVIGNPTVGIGRNLYGKGLSESEISFLLKNDIAEIEVALIKFDWFAKCTSTRRDALVNMAFNLGMAGLLSFKSMIAALEASNYDAAAAGLLNSKAARELPARYGRLATAIRMG